MGDDEVIGRASRNFAFAMTGDPFVLLHGACVKPYPHDHTRDFKQFSFEPVTSYFIEQLEHIK